MKFNVVLKFPFYEMTRQDDRQEQTLLDVTHNALHSKIVFLKKSSPWRTNDKLQVSLKLLRDNSHISS